MSESLDPADWESFRALAHGALDDTIDALRDIAAAPPWQPIPPAVRGAIAADALPLGPAPLAAVYDDFNAWVAPYAVDNRHPRFFGWVHGAGTPAGMLAELLAAGLNANVGGRDHAAVEIERRVIRWWCEVFGFPAGASGILTTGTSMANLIGVLVARRKALGGGVRTAGIGDATLAGYTSSEAHGSVARAFDVAGLGTHALRAVSAGADFTLPVAALREAIAAGIARAARRRSS